MKRFPIAILACAAALFAISPTHAIVGRTRNAAHPSIVMVLGRGASGSGYCSGVVVARNAVLTAAHCVRAAADMRVHFKDVSGAPVLLDVTSVTRHPGYASDAVAKRARSVDLAIVFTQAALPDGFVPAQLASASTAIGSPFTIAGFGIANEQNATTGGVLRATDVSLRAPISTLLLWLSGEGGACTGDSGGPVLDPQGTVVGVIAYAEGSSGRACGTLTQAVRTAPFADWIEAEAGRR